MSETFTNSGLAADGSQGDLGSDAPTESNDFNAIRSQSASEILSGVMEEIGADASGERPNISEGLSRGPQTLIEKGMTGGGIREPERPLDEGAVLNETARLHGFEDRASYEAALEAERAQEAADRQELGRYRLQTAIESGDNVQLFGKLIELGSAHGAESQELWDAIGYVAMELNGVVPNEDGSLDPLDEEDLWPTVADIAQYVAMGLEFAAEDQRRTAVQQLSEKMASERDAAVAAFYGKSGVDGFIRDAESAESLGIDLPAALSELPADKVPEFLATVQEAKREFDRQAAHDQIRAGIMGEALPSDGNAGPNLVELLARSQVSPSQTMRNVDARVRARAAAAPSAIKAGILGETKRASIADGLTLGNRKAMDVSPGEWQKWFGRG